MKSVRLKNQRLKLIVTLQRYRHLKNVSLMRVISSIDYEIRLSCGYFYIYRCYLWISEVQVLVYLCCRYWVSIVWCNLKILVFLFLPFRVSVPTDSPSSRSRDWDGFSSGAWFFSGLRSLIIPLYGARLIRLEKFGKNLK